MSTLCLPLDLLFLSEVADEVLDQFGEAVDNLPGVFQEPAESWRRVMGRSTPPAYRGGLLPGVVCGLGRRGVSHPVVGASAEADFRSGAADARECGERVERLCHR
jgi:hypothetical protein